MVAVVTIDVRSIELGGEGFPFDPRRRPSGAFEEFALECTDSGGVSTGLGIDCLGPNWPALCGGP